jgi:hypothetical protein
VSLERKYYLITGKNGVLDDTTPPDHIAKIFLNEVGTQSHIILYFHGGLVPRASGLEIATMLAPRFLSINAYPLFFVYETGFLEIVSRNLNVIAGEDVFKTLVKRLLKFAISKLRNPLGARGLTSVPPTDIELHKELVRRAEGEEPFADESIDRSVSPVSESEQRDLREELKKDKDLMATIEAIGADTQEVTTTTFNTRGLFAQTRKSPKTLMSPDVVDEIMSDVASAQAQGSRGLLSTATLLYRAGKIMVRVIERFRETRDHGIYTTVVEETLREFYIANIGTAVWEAIKAETLDTFVDTPEKNRGGVCVLDGLAKLLNSLPKDNRPRISLVGHSTGGVFINNLLATVAQRKKAGVWPKDFSFEHIVLLAPACTFWEFDKAIQFNGSLFSTFRVFGMTDAAECKDAIVPLVYTRSLLYFVSGLLEKGPDGKPAADVPLVGMQKFYIKANVYSSAAENMVRNFVSDSTLAIGARRWVWSPSSEGVGLNSESLKHGDFDNEEKTITSVLNILR